jgi:hypothetical protein
LRNHLVAGLNKAHKVIVLNVLVSEGKLAHEARVCLTEDGMTVSWHDLAASKGILHVLSDIILSPLVTKFSLEVE